MMHGLPGTGKSFVAQKIAEKFPNVVILKSVQFRRDTGNSSVGRFDENNPETKREKDDTYKLLCQAARNALEKGKTPVLDATFHKKYRREWVYQLGVEMKADVFVISVTCDEPVIFDRLKNREKQDSSDAFLKSKEAYEIMRQQQDELNDTGILIKGVDTTELNLGDFIKWLNPILS
jgi:hypothetical protein